eukprot:CAMPEP_0184468858 /NCGR_PEP_ID=MMETSP0740-20130409/81813_1 /TAXON_ID=385413 /ORGANISM="Thalassiosira miniscula, Strain CCMP1093" /LENGTH=122 /DNA_ID=CAMNT_0026844591 /DNA_START=37 /DNA_END=402 /DNA_ORIENTATION=+
MAMPRSFGLTGSATVWGSWTKRAPALSTICTKEAAMKRVIKIFAMSSALLAGPVSAEGPTEGCYVRDYSTAHLARQPAQVVDWMQMWVYSDQNQNKLANMRVGFTDQGHVANSKHAGKVLDQ